ncbi:MAG: hypothetical protein HKN41_07490 [Ilumatobacter sp.]|nr:hypothetical protein [Ilumatobacter sp.]
MDVLLLVALLAFVVGLWTVGLAAFISAARLPSHAWRAAKRSKGGTLIGIALAGGFGGAYYWLSIRPAVVDAQQHSSAPPKRDPWSNDGW